MTNLFLLFNFNNYFNRKLVRYDTLAQYKQAVSNDFIEIDNAVNFNPGDGVATSQIVDLGAYSIDLREPNYLLVCDERNDVKQRWFVTECDRTRGGQFKCTLYRDTVAEAWDTIKTAPCFIEKAIVNEADPAIYNDENITVNQIKKSQTLIKDSSGVAWIVGYLAPDNLPREKYITTDNNENVITVNSLDTWEYYKYITEPTTINYFDTRIFVDAADGEGWAVPHYRVWASYNNYSAATVTQARGTTLRVGDLSKSLQFAKKLKENAGDVISAIEVYDYDKIKELKNIDSSILYDSSQNKFYKITFETSIEYTGTHMFINEDSELKGIFDGAVAGANETGYLAGTAESNVAKNAYSYTTNKIVERIKLVDLTETTYSYSIPNVRRRLDDQPYSMFAMEYNSTNMKVARSMSAQLGSALYDLQLLPYRPAFYASTAEKDVTPITKNGTQVGEIHWCYHSEFERVVSWTETIGSVKINCLTKLYRLCSPNWNGVFEFNAGKNKGLTGFKIKCCYKPYQPFIQVVPEFDGLYGMNFKDGRGLICGGKFDLPQTSEAWASYERQNTNYNAIFNRQIENLETQQKYQRWGDILGAVGGTAQNISSGALTGAAIGSSGGPAGAVIGGVVGGVAGVGAGIADVYVGDKLRAEQMDYTKDMYALSLQNIQAQPSSLVGIGALTNANTIFPVLEIYDCTDKERRAVIDKITYNGMTVNRIGTINEFKNNTWSYNNGWNYIKGQLIRVDVPDTDWHFVNTLKSELERGLFIKRGEP